MADSWHAPIAAIYVIALSSLVGGLLYLLRRPRPVATVTTAHIAEQPTLPPVIAAHLLDASIPPPASPAPTTYCPECWLRWVAQPTHMYAEPEGMPWFCDWHVGSTLARAYDARGLSLMPPAQQTGEK